jgi:predicted amino acid-binding ACT domain protein
MATDYNAAVSCLAGAFTSFITKEASLLTERMASIVASFTDPLDALASTNVSQAVDSVSSLSEGSVAGNLASIGEAIIINKIQRELNDILADVIKANPAIGDAIQRITNLSSAVYGIISLAVMLRKEAPYSAVKIVIEELEEMLDTKETNLNQLSQHIIQLNNVLMSTTDNPTTAAQALQDDFAEVSEELGNAAEDLLALETSMYATPSVYVEKDLDAAEVHLTTAESKLSPSTDVNLLDVGSAIAQDALGTEFLTDAQIKMSSYAVRPLTIVINCELTAIDKVTKKINTALAQLPNIIPSYEDAVESNAMLEFRVKLVRQLRIRVEALKDDIDASKTLWTPWRSMRCPGRAVWGLSMTRFPS